MSEGTTGRNCDRVILGETVRGYHGERLSEGTTGRDCQRVPTVIDCQKGYHGE